jgi:uncharacterized heparinase superfamily protein
VYGGSTLWVTHYRTKIIETFHDNSMDMVYASHDGYNKMGILHSRKIEFNRKTNDVLITDMLNSSSPSEYKIEIPFHLSPGFNVTKESENSFLIQKEKTKVRLVCDPQLMSEIFTGSEDPKLGWYSESFQVIKPTSVIYCSKLIKFSVQFTFKISILEI